MSTKISEWRSLVSPNAGGQTSTVIDKYVLDTIRDFCERTKVWQAKHDDIDVVANTAAYTLAYTAADVCGAIKAKFDGHTMDPVKERDLNREEPDWEDSTSTTPTRYFVNQTKQINLVYTPSAALADGLEVWVYLKPELTATTVEDFLYEEYRNTITDGSAAKLLKVAGTTKQNLAMSGIFQANYDLEVARVRTRVERGLSNAPLKGGTTGYI